MTPALDLMGELEAARDPKCHATATRLENFIYGTPLSDEARELKNKLLKAWARSAWSQAARGADGEISREQMAAAVAKTLTFTPTNDGGFQVKSGKLECTITGRDLRHYSSVAYSLRIILSLQQDDLLSSDPIGLLLSDDATSLIKERLDILSLVVLQNADAICRRQDVSEVGAEQIKQAWHQFLSNEPLSEPDMRDGSAGLLRPLVEEKIRAYAGYNSIRQPLFVRNVQVYFARLSWPATEAEAARFQGQFVETCVGFAADLYRSAEVLAKREGRVIVRGNDVSRAAQTFLPHLVDEYEDVLFFPKLSKDRQIAIEAYDLDAFRDSGAHWQYLGFALDDLEKESLLEADPFAAEILVENIAQFGVLILRAAGRIGQIEDKERLSVELLGKGIASVQKRIDEHANAPVRPSAKPNIQSAPTGPKAGAARMFDEVTDSSGIDYTHRSSDWLNRQLRGFLKKDENTGVITIPPAFGGSGIAAGDVDSDGKPDLLLLGGLGNRLYRNLGDGTFEDITRSSGLQYLRDDDRHPGESRQPLIADFDNDGHQDVLITYVNDPHRLYRGAGDGTFVDVTDSSGLGGGSVGGPATCFDADGDGLLDVYIQYFGDYLNGELPTLKRKNSNGLENKLLRNLGNMTFKDITATAGVGDRGWGQATIHTDFNGDGRQDLISGNDFGVNRYYANRGNGRFAEVSAAIGTDKPSYTMSLSSTDLNGDQLPEIYVSNIVTMNKDEKYVLPNEDTRMKFNLEKLANLRVIEANDLFMSRTSPGEGVKYTLSREVLQRGHSATGWSWDADFFDADLDGDDDLYVLNGMNEFNLYSSRNPYFMDPDDLSKENAFLPVSPKERNVFFSNQEGRLVNASTGSGLDFEGNSRSAVYLDIDADGDLDVVTHDYHGRSRVFRNNSEGSWIELKLTGSSEAGINRDAIGAKVVFTLGDGRTIWREVRGSTGYMSVHPKVVHAGLGGDKEVKATVIWPNGTEQDLGSLEGGKRHFIDYPSKP